MKHLPLLSVALLATSLSAVAQSSFDDATTSTVAPSSRTDFTVSATGASSTSADILLAAPASASQNGIQAPTAAPEPAAFALIGVGVATLVAAKRRRSASI